MVSDTQAVPTLFIYHPWHIDLMVAESLLSSGLLKHVPVNKKERRKKKKRRRRRRKGREMTYPIPLRKHSRRPPGLFNPQLEFSPRPHLTAMEVGEGKLLNHWDQCGLFYYFSFQENLQEGVTTAPQVCFWVCILNKTQSSQEDSHSSELSVFLNSIPLPTLYIIIHILRKGTRVKISRDRGSASLFLWQLLLYFFGGKKKLLR